MLHLVLGVGVGIQPFAPKPAESLILADAQWLTWPFLSFELQVWPQAHPDMQLPSALTSSST
jgi:hypothetical protein